MHLGEFKREIEYLDPGLPVEEELVEPKRQLQHQLDVDTPLRAAVLS